MSNVSCSPVPSGTSTGSANSGWPTGMGAATWAHWSLSRVPEAALIRLEGSEVGGHELLPLLLLGEVIARRIGGGGR
jgi:hypothetical protein